MKRKKRTTSRTLANELATLRERYLGVVAVIIAESTYKAVPMPKGWRSFVRLTPAERTSVDLRAQRHVAELARHGTPAAMLDDDIPF